MDRKELISLRISVARIAQSLELGEHIPGGRHLKGNPASYRELCTVANTIDRGWNGLAGRIIEAINAKS